MLKLPGKMLPIASLVLLTLGPAAQTLADKPDNVAVPRVKPLAEHTIGIKPWELESQSPFGASRWGGVDERQFAFSQDGKLLASEDAGGWQLELWEVATGKSLGRFGQINNPVALAFSPNGKLLVTTETRLQGGCSVELWDVARRKKTRQLDEDVNDIPFTAVAFSPDGRTLALGGWGLRTPGKLAFHLWDVASGDQVYRFDGPTFSEEAAQGRGSKFLECLCFAPDGRSLALVVENKVLLWELATGKERCLVGMLPRTYALTERFQAASSVAFSPDGQTLAVGCADGAVRLWDVLQGRQLPPLVGHQGGVRALWYAPDGKTLRSLGWDKRVLTWPVTGPVRDWRPREEKLSEKALQALWDDLLSDDPLVLFGVVRRLAAAHDQTLLFLRERLKPVAAVDLKRTTQLVADLENDDFAERKKAVSELRKLGELALPALRQVAGRRPQGIQSRILEKMESQYPTREQLRALRAMDILEQMGTDQAGRMLGELANGAPDSLLTRQAKAALERRPKTGAPRGGEVKLEALWTELVLDDPRLAFQAMRALTARRQKAVRFLHDQIRLTAASGAFDDDPQRLARLIADLGRDDFVMREKAAKQLAKLGQRAAPALQKALEDPAGLEVKRRIESLLKDVATPTLSSEWLRAERALEVLEQIGTDEVRQTLEPLGKEMQNRHWLKTRITESLRRLGK